MKAIILLFLFCTLQIAAQKPQIFKSTSESFSTMKGGNWSEYVNMGCAPKTIEVTKKAIIIQGDTIKLIRRIGAKIGSDCLTAFVYTARDGKEICHVVIVKGDAIKEIQVRKLNQRTLYK
jgi:hypothetical protein